MTSATSRVAAAGRCKPWLDEAYRDSWLACADTGVVARNLGLRSLCFLLFKALYRGHVGTVLDYGGGDGLLVRMLRDAGIDAYYFDKFGQGRYCRGFEAQPTQRFDAVTAFEVLEHLANPAEDLDAIFGRSSDLVLVSTLLYQGQGADWWYLAPETGQHVFFYTHDAMRIIAERFGYDVVGSNQFTLFSRERLRPQRLQLPY